MFIKHALTFHDDKLVSYNPSHLLGSYNLQFKKVQVSDAGTYRCVFSHGDVNESDDVTFTVKERKNRKKKSG